MLFAPLYDPKKTYEENFKKGPFGAFANKEVIENKGDPKFLFFGSKVSSPFGIAAGPLINGRFVKAALDKGFDIVTYKTVRSAEYPCHPWPNVVSVNVSDELMLHKDNPQVLMNSDFKEPLSITNSFGVPSYDPEFWQKDIAQALKSVRPGQVLVGAFQGTKREGQSKEEYVNDFRVTVKLLKDAGVKVVEVNLSCPNEGASSILCYDTDRSVEVVQAIKIEIGDIPLIIKIGYFKDDNALRELVKKIGNLVQGISAINTISAEIVD